MVSSYSTSMSIPRVVNGTPGIGVSQNGQRHLSLQIHFVSPVAPHHVNNRQISFDVSHVMNECQNRKSEG